MHRTTNPECGEHCTGGVCSRGKGMTGEANTTRRICVPTGIILAACASLPRAAPGVGMRCICARFIQGSARNTGIGDTPPAPNDECFHLNACGFCCGFFCMLHRFAS